MKVKSTLSLYRLQQKHQGKHTVLLEGTEITTGEKFSQTAELLISTNRKLSLTLLDSPEFIKAGETIKSTFVLKNDGNVSENLILESKNAIVDENTSLILAPRESKKISISKITPSNLSKNEFQNLNLSVYSKDHPQENHTAYSSVKIISVKPIEDDIYHRFPVSASVSILGMQNRGQYKNGFQGELY